MALPPPFPQVRPTDLITLHVFRIDFFYCSWRLPSFLNSWLRLLVVQSQSVHWFSLFLQRPPLFNSHCWCPSFTHSSFFDEPDDSLTISKLIPAPYREFVDVFSEKSALRIVLLILTIPNPSHDEFDLFGYSWCICCGLCWRHFDFPLVWMIIAFTFLMFFPVFAPKISSPSFPNALLIKTMSNS